MSKRGTIHIVGAGLAGLAAAIRVAGAKHYVALYEAASHAGGRCRSYLDRDLGLRIDNGNHLMLTCNWAALDYLDTVGALNTVHIAPEAVFPFADLQTNERWKLKIGEGRLPFWIFDSKARVPGTRWQDYVKGGKLLNADRWATVENTLDKNSVLYRRFWAPMAISILNTAPHEASARLLGDVFREAFGAGGTGCHPMMVKEGLSESFVDPALAYLQERGADMKFGMRLRALEIGSTVKKLVFANETIEIGEWDSVVLALPAWVINDLLPNIPMPKQFRSIVNAHFKFDVPKSREGLLGVIGGNVEWVFEKEGIVSTTTSAAEKIVDLSAEELAALLWRDVAKLYNQNPEILPPYRIVKERRATFAATPDDIIRRPKIETRHTNLVICGDWTNTGLPSTIEGAIRSGRKAAECLLPPRALE